MGGRRICHGDGSPLSDRDGQSERVEAVLLTGLFGVGKSTIAAEMADLSWRTRGCPTLRSTWTGGRGATSATAMSEPASMPCRCATSTPWWPTIARRACATSCWRGGSAPATSSAGLVATMAMPVHTVELTAPLEEITRRLVTDPTAGRRDDLAESAAWVEKGRGSSFAEYTVENHGPVRDVAADILQWLDWLSQAGA